MTVLSATFGSPFREQVAALRLRLANPVPTQAWDDLLHDQHERAFVIAGAMKADLLADLAAAVDRAVVEHRSFDKFKAEFLATADAHNWRGWTGDTTEKGRAWRARVIYRTNMATSYASGRMAQLVDGKFKFWVYSHGNAMEPRLQHLAWDGVALPPDHPFWQSHAPPNGWGCTCSVYGANTAAGVRRMGGDPDKLLPDGWQMPDPKTGAPRGIDKGWDYAVGASVSDDIARALGKIPNHPAAIGADLAASLLSKTATEQLVAQFDAFVTKSLSSYVEQNFMIVGALKPNWVAAAKLQNIQIASAEIAVTDKNIQHSFRGTLDVTTPSTKAKHPGQAPKVAPVDLAWYRQLPAHLQSPDAVLIDTSKAKPTFILIFDIPPNHAKLVIEIGSDLSKAARILNTVQSGRIVSARDLKIQLGQGMIQIEGRAIE
ncbi:MAG: hypothetical protein JWS10_939 [Cypionkella sp.]|uniref:phage head morphogenesis protein n=1 Tax=Cypionkella sp. TaxID=2811411 RepID=UPI0026212703|nr:phage minor head protein [Cypionkella sp.]MDB5658324.1 hypothetical protein [Cypionkella sp.]